MLSVPAGPWKGVEDVDWAEVELGCRPRVGLGRPLVFFLSGYLEVVKSTLNPAKSKANISALLRKYEECFTHVNSRDCRPVFMFLFRILISLEHP